MRIKSLPAALLLLSCLGLAQAAKGALVWEKTEFRIPVSLGQERLVVEFPFRNTGDEAVVILDIKHSCGCTTGELEQAIYEPGETGSLSVTVDLRNMSGELVKRITVTSSGKEEAADVLWLYTDVPVPFKLTPAILSWKAFGDIIPRQLRLRIHEDLDISPGDVEVIIDDRD